MEFDQFASQWGVDQLVESFKIKMTFIKINTVIKLYRCKYVLQLLILFTRIVLIYMYIYMYECMYMYMYVTAAIIDYSLGASLLFLLDTSVSP